MGCPVGFSPSGFLLCRGYNDVRKLPTRSNCPGIPIEIFAEDSAGSFDRTLRLCRDRLCSPPDAGICVYFVGAIPDALGSNRRRAILTACVESVLRWRRSRRLRADAGGAVVLADDDLGWIRHAGRRPL